MSMLDDTAPQLVPVQEREVMDVDACEESPVFILRLFLNVDQVPHSLL